MARRRQAIKYSALGWHGKVFRTTGYWCGESTGHHNINITNTGYTVFWGVFLVTGHKKISYWLVIVMYRVYLITMWDALFPYKKTQSKYNTAFNCRDKENIRKHLILPTISHLNIWRWNIIYWVIFRKDTVCVVQVCLEAPNVISCLPCPSSCQPAGQKLHL